MTEVVIAGLGQTPVGEHWTLSLLNLAARAAQAARRDAGDLRPQALYVGNVLSPTAQHQANLGALIAEDLGLAGIEGVTVEAAGASGAAALRTAYIAVCSGMVDVALVVGVEKYTDVRPAEAEALLAQTLDSDFEALYGMTPATQAGLLMQRYLYDYHLPRYSLSGFPLVAHANAAGNPNAMFRKAITQEAYENAEMVYDPLNLYDIAPYADGAAALIVTRSELVPASVTHPLVSITGSSLVSDTLALHDRSDPLAWLAAGFSVERACRQAGILPTDVDLFEYCDAFSIYAALSLEAAGFARRGQGWQLAQDGSLALTGKLPAATLGGLKGRGNPIGASGVYQVVEAALQLRGQAGRNQVKDARRALVQALGGPASTAVTHVLERMV
jgi:acetyl-CoA C-acetyltransferase